MSGHRNQSDDVAFDPLSEEAGVYLCRLARAALVAALAPEGINGVAVTPVADSGTLLGPALGAGPRPNPDAVPDSIPPELLESRGLFVTLLSRAPREHEERLRGCVGRLTDDGPLWQTVAEVAVDAALGDTRFPVVTAAELDRIAIELTVLSPPREVASWTEIRLGMDGIILEKSGCRALFLPQVAHEHGWTLEQTLDALARKAGLAPDAWRGDARLEVFQGQVIHEREEP